MIKECSITFPYPHCGRRSVAHDLCAGHLRRKTVYGDLKPEVPLHIRRSAGSVPGTCIVVSCTSLVDYVSRGWCRQHYNIARLHDWDPLWVPVNEAAQYLLQEVSTPSLGCKIWPYRKDPDGYGLVSLGGKSKRVHIYSCEINWGPKPTSRSVVRHGSCHTPSCWAFEHLSWGSQKENHQDRWRDGTPPVGEQNGRAKLTDVQVLEIRTRRVDEVAPYLTLAVDYGVSQSLIAMICRGEIWKHLLPDALEGTHT